MLGPSLNFFAIDVVHKKYAFFEHEKNFQLTYIFYHCDNCCDKFDLRGIEIFRRKKVSVCRLEEKLLFSR